MQGWGDVDMTERSPDAVRSADKDTVGEAGAVGRPPGAAVLDQVLAEVSLDTERYDDFVGNSNVVESVSPTRSGEESVALVDSVGVGLAAPCDLSLK